jgi:serine/threonine protein kinase/Tol biopolymer transport system component
MPLAPGTRLGNYDIVATLGAGGMGEVYQARDSRLKRDVAIKLLPEAFAHDAERVARFEREAQALASLKHPHIGAIYELGESGTSRFLVLELVEGQTLADRLKRGAMPVPEALSVARQIIDALDAAHEKGIVHRDLKPSNIMLTPDGGAKLLDLGLAKLTAVDVGAGDQSFTHSPTMLASMTGTILGTAAYMSPEQATGKAVDKRTDIWAFAVVLYEMLTGESLFHAETLQETLARVLKDEPDLSRVAIQLRPLLRRCLVRNPKSRLRDVADATLLLDDSPQAIPIRVGRRWPWPMAAAAFAVVAAFAVWAPWRTPPPEPTVTRFVVSPPEGNDFESSIKLSPNGRKLAFAAAGRDGRRRLWTRDMNSVTAQPLPGTELQTQLGGAVSWSPDNRFVAFTDGNRLMKIDVTSSEPPVAIATLPSVAGETSWSSQGIILVGTISGGPIWRVPEAGGDPIPVTAPGASAAHAFPFFLPDERHFLYLRTDKAAGIYVGSLDVKPEEQPAERLVACESQAFYVPSGRSGPGWLVFIRDGRVMAQSFDASRLALAGEPVMVAPSVASVGARALFTASSDGTLAYRSGSELRFMWLDRKGNSLNSLAETTPASFARISPDGTHVAFDRVSPSGGDVWLLELARNVTTRLTFDRAHDEFPIWSPDRRVMFRSDRGGVFDLYEKSADGAGEDRLVLHTAFEKWPEDWSDDGRYVVYEERANGQDDLWLLRMSDQQPAPLTRTPFNESFGEFSPDGRWIAYQSNQTGRDEVYIRPFPDSAATASSVARAYQVSQDGGQRPLWRRDGRELVFIGSNRTVFAVDVDGSAGMRTGRPRPLFQMPVGFEEYTRLEMDPNGERFLAKAQTNNKPPITVVMNWPATLRR